MRRWMRVTVLMLGLVAAGHSATRMALGESGGTSSSGEPGARVGISALGRIEPRTGVRHVAGPPRPAVVIAKVLVEEGDRVAQGQELAVLQGIGLQEADVARFQAELA